MSWRFEGLDEAVAELTRSLDAELPKGMLRATELVGAEARRVHDYQNRTGLLEERTMSGGTTSSTHHVVGKVVGDTHYGSYIEDGTPTIRPRRFLALAYERRLSGVVAEMSASLHAAAASADGWRAGE